MICNVLELVEAHKQQKRILEPIKTGWKKIDTDDFHHAFTTQRSSTGGPLRFILRDLDMHIRGLSENDPTST